MTVFLVSAAITPEVEAFSMASHILGNDVLGQGLIGPNATAGHWKQPLVTTGASTLSSEMKYESRRSHIGFQVVSSGSAPSQPPGAETYKTQYRPW